MEKSVTIGRLIAAAHKKAYQYAAIKLKTCDIEVGQFFFLRYIMKNQGISQEEVAQKMYLDKATVSKGVNILVRNGYIQKKANPKDKREYRLFATKKANQMEEMVDSIHKEINEYLVKELNEEEILTLRNLLNKIVNQSN
ncbi:MAG: MarR family transcriptional regulator [Bacteroidales bacterium]|nr:MarR family transcriptional regulator [Bacteroidales bacterium]